VASKTEKELKDFVEGMTKTFAIKLNADVEKVYIEMNKRSVEKLINNH